MKLYIVHIDMEDSTIITATPFNKLDAAKYGILGVSYVDNILSRGYYWSDDRGSFINSYLIDVDFDFSKNTDAQSQVVIFMYRECLRRERNSKIDKLI
jgi:hypothetical protein